MILGVGSVGTHLPSERAVTCPADALRLMITLTTIPMVME